MKNFHFIAYKIILVSYKLQSNVESVIEVKAKQIIIKINIIDY